MTTKYADLKLIITVAFEDDGENDLVDQALDAEINSQIISDATIEILGPVRDTEYPE